MSVVEGIRQHAQEIARQASELAEHLVEVDEADVLPLPAAVALVDLERVRADLFKATDAFLVHLEPRHQEPAANH